MRSDPTVGERLLWHELRARRLGVKFRRQVPVGPFIPDFVCHAKRLVVEVDGESHDDSSKDRRRDRWFIARDWFVLRFSGDDVANDMDWVLDVILLALHDPSQIHDPLNTHWRG
jgi:very-short-patch-repair endonuclease